MAQASQSTKIFVVSLKTAVDRRDTFRKRATAAGSSWEFFDAHTALGADLSYSDADALKYKGRALRLGELGCYSSHYHLWKQLVDDDAKQYIILEDDVIVDWKAIFLISSVDFERSSLNYVRLYYKKPCKFIVRNRHFLTRNFSLIELTNLAFGTQGYVITKSGAASLIKYCEDVCRPIDDQMDRFWDHGLPNLCLFPFPLMEEAVASTIGNERFADTGTKKSPPLVRRLLGQRDNIIRRLAVERRRKHSQEWIALPHEKQ
jgi:glycosyl transferase family 25